MIGQGVPDEGLALKRYNKKIFLQVRQCAGVYKNFCTCSSFSYTPALRNRYTKYFPYYFVTQKQKPLRQYNLSINFTCNNLLKSKTEFWTLTFLNFNYISTTSWHMKLISDWSNNHINRLLHVLMCAQMHPAAYQNSSTLLQRHWEISVQL